jgi:hypothetical protein
LWHSTFLHINVQSSTKTLSLPPTSLPTDVTPWFLFLQILAGDPIPQPKHTVPLKNAHTTHYGARCRWLAPELIQGVGFCQGWGEAALEGQDPRIWTHWSPQTLFSSGSC